MGFSDIFTLSPIKKALENPGFSDFLLGSDDEIKQVPIQSKQQGKFQNSILSQLMNMQGKGGGYGNALSILQDYLNPQSDVYRNFEAPYLRQFNDQTVPGIAERFAGFGANSGALSSSGFGQALGAAGAGLQENLAGMKSNLQRQSIRDLLGQYNQLAQYGLGTQQFENIYQPGSTGALGGILSGIGGGIGTSIGGPIGGAIGSNLGGSLGSAASSSLRSGFSPAGGGGPSPMSPSGYKGSFGQLPSFGGF